MTVSEFIEWLKKQPQENEVVVRDADTEWLLPALKSPALPCDEITKDGTTIIYTSY